MYAYVIHFFTHGVIEGAEAAAALSRAAQLVSFSPFRLNVRAFCGRRYYARQMGHDEKAPADPRRREKPLRRAKKVVANARTRRDFTKRKMKVLATGLVFFFIAPGISGTRGGADRDTGSRSDRSISEYKLRQSPLARIPILSEQLARRVLKSR